MNLHELLMSDHRSQILHYYEIWLNDHDRVPPHIDVMLQQAADIDELRQQLPRIKFLVEFRNRLEQIWNLPHRV